MSKAPDRLPVSCRRPAPWPAAGNRRRDDGSLRRGPSGSSRVRQRPATWRSPSSRSIDNGDLTSFGYVDEDASTGALQLKRLRVAGELGFAQHPPSVALIAARAPPPNPTKRRFATGIVADVVGVVAEPNRPHDVTVGQSDELNSSSWPFAIGDDFLRTRPRCPAARESREGFEGDG